MKIPLLYAGNRAVFDGIVISLLSATRYCLYPLDVYLLTMDLRDRDPKFQPLTEEQRAYLEALCRERNSESRVRLIDVGDLYRKTLLHSPNAETGYTPYCFLRLFADCLPELPDKLIYLDTDTLFCDDPLKLYTELVDGYELAGVRDRYGCRFFGANYLNSGVLLLNLAEIRRTGLFRRAVDLCATQKLFLPDQTAINRLARKKKILPRCFNEQKEARRDTVIRHFSMTIQWIPFRTQSVKPWQVDRVHQILKTFRFDGILNEYLRRRPSFPCAYEA
ncbi:MAG: glycosyltransferase family 8 protein [Ruminococcaceae bacterium]|nr:glycosyltransferase family 8 protein [Oscillospiraceae bacterium]